MANEHAASVYGKDIPISTKHAIEICNFIRGKSIPQSKRMLKEVLGMKIAVPFKIYKRNVGHKPGRMAAGRYPTKASHLLIDNLQRAIERAYWRQRYRVASLRHRFHYLILLWQILSCST